MYSNKKLLSTIYNSKPVLRKGKDFEDLLVL